MYPSKMKCASVRFRLLLPEEGNWYSGTPGDLSSSSLVNTHFDKDTENLLMAELISLRIWFAQRTGSSIFLTTPVSALGDQVRM